MNEEEAIEMYKELKKHKKIIGNIDTDFFFEFAETVLNLLEKKDETIIETKEANRQLSVELQKKDKIINKLEDIFYNYQLCEYELTDCTYRKCEYIADDEIPPCKDCIKQYFERKCEDDRSTENM